MVCVIISPWDVKLNWVGLSVSLLFYFYCYFHDLARQFQCYIMTFLLLLQDASCSGEAPEEDKEIQEVTDKLAHADRVGSDDVVLFDQN